MPQMEFNFEGLIQLLAENLYSEKKVFLRELIQNAHDAIQRRSAVDSGFSARTSGRIDILTDDTQKSGTLVVKDNGIGMSREDLESYLSSIGSSGTRKAKFDEEIPDLIGQFGIGFLSSFVVAKRVTVTTRKIGENVQAWRWHNDGSKTYQLEPTDKPMPGTEVEITLANQEDRGFLQEVFIRNFVRTYADMLRIPIYLNYSSTPINHQQMPWEDQSLDTDKRLLECFIYLEKTVPDSVLEVIPLPENDIGASGLLYITRTRVIGRDAPRTLRIFQKRMFVSENCNELLPTWATFVNGIVNINHLKPNAARDSFIRDDNFDRVRSSLGAIIIHHFEVLQKANPSRLSEILSYHELAIKAACGYYDEFFDKFIHLLEWKVNKGALTHTVQKKSLHTRFHPDSPGNDHVWLTLPQILESLPEPVKGSQKRLAVFTTTSSANQYFDMANAAGTMVVDASRFAEKALIEQWAEQNASVVKLVHVDREMDPDVFKVVDPDQDKAVLELSKQMSSALRSSKRKVNVTARRFQPAELPAVVKTHSSSKGQEKAYEILDNPNAPTELKIMAEEMLKMSTHAEMRMTINASNKLVNSLALLGQKLGYKNSDIQELMLGIYNDAILYNQELMTPSNAKIFHEQFGRLMHKIVQFISERETNIIEKQRAVDSPAIPFSVPGQSIKAYHSATLLTPRSTHLTNIYTAIQSIFEDTFACQMRFDTAKNADVFDADIFIVDISGLDPKVMFQMGNIQSIYPQKILLLIAEESQIPKQEDIPEAISQPICATYRFDDEMPTIIPKLKRAFLSHDQLQKFLTKDPKKQFISAKRLYRITSEEINLELCKSLSKELPTYHDWVSISIEHFKQHLGEDERFAERWLKRIVSDLKYTES